MTNHPQNCPVARHTIHAALVLLLTASAARSAVAADMPTMPRVRSTSRSIAALISRATEQSVTFRRLIHTIEASDGLVYVEEGRCRHGVRACLSHAVTLAGPNRVLQIRIDTRMADRNLMASIGHELQHAVEVLNNRALTSTAAIHFFYSGAGAASYGTSSAIHGAIETEAAFQAGETVRRELRHGEVRPRF